MQFCDNSFITEPTAKSDCSVPSRSSSPKILVNLESWSVAPSPRSSNATLIWSAARTKPSTSFSEVLPRRPASCASWLSCSREERVSIFLNSSLRCSTCSAVRPVYLRTLAISWSISAYICTACLPAITAPVSAATPPTATVCQRCHVLLNRSSIVWDFPSSAFTLEISFLTSLIFLTCSFQALEPRSI